MAKLVIGIVIGALGAYLAMNGSEEAPAPVNLNEDPTYVANKAVVETMFQALIDKNLEAWSAIVSDTVKYTAAAYTPDATPNSGTKGDWLKSLQNMDEFDDLAVEQVVYLPGLDGVTSEPNGSVRVYVHYNATHSSGLKIDPWFYLNINSFEGGKITSYQSFGDIGGVMNQIAAASAGE